MPRMLSDVRNRDTELSEVEVSIPVECCNSESWWFMNKYSGGARNRRASKCELTTVNRKYRGKCKIKLSSIY